MDLLEALGRTMELTGGAGSKVQVECTGVSQVQEEHYAGCKVQGRYSVSREGSRREKLQGGNRH